MERCIPVCVSENDFRKEKRVEAKETFREIIEGGKAVEEREKNKVDSEKYFDDLVQNAAFICCIDILAELIEKYGDRVIDAISNDSIANENCDYTIFVNDMNVVCEMEKLSYIEILKSYVQMAVVDGRLSKIA